MDLSADELVLLLDLDCVTIYGGNPREGLPPEVYHLHPDMVRLLQESSIPVVLFTHRSKQEAALILNFFAEYGLTFSACISAKELFYSALGQFRVLDLLNHGLSKKYGLRRVARQFNTKASSLVLIDDRLENLEEVLNEGARIAIHAPFEKTVDGVTTFEFSELLDILSNDPIARCKGVITLTPVTRAFSNLPVIGEINENTVDLFETIRMLAKRTRNKLRLLSR